MVPEQEELMEGDEEGLLLGEESATEQSASAEPQSFVLGDESSDDAPEESLEEDDGVMGADKDDASEVSADAVAAGDDKAKKPAKKKKTKVVQTLKELDPERAALPWYAVHTYSGFEMRVKLSLEERIKLLKLEKKFGNVLVPEETVVELVRGQKKTSQRKFLPGYILVQMHFDEDTWHLVRETPKVTGFVGDSRNPSPLAQEEVQGLITQMQGGAVKPKPKVNFEQGDAIKVIDGPFAEFNGIVDEVKTDKGKLRVLISIFGRNTPVELDFVQVEKI